MILKAWATRLCLCMVLHNVLDFFFLQRIIEVEFLRASDCYPSPFAPERPHLQSLKFSIPMGLWNTEEQTEAPMDRSSTLRLSLNALCSCRDLLRLSHKYEVMSNISDLGMRLILWYMKRIVTNGWVQHASHLEKQNKEGRSLILV